MQIIKPYVEVDRFNNNNDVLRTLEHRGRVAYKSEDKITNDSASKFVSSLVKSGHESVLEHVTIGAKFVIDRAISHELVRHRIGVAYTQESTRYCNYSKADEITVIEPYWFLPADHPNSESAYWDTWYKSCLAAEQAYMELIASGASPQWARSVLPNSLKTEIEVTANLREWRHIFKLRAQRDAHPQMQQVMIPLLRCFQAHLPEIYASIGYNTAFPSAYYAIVKWR